MGHAGLEEAHLRVAAQHAVDDADRAHHPPVLVVVGVEDERPQRRRASTVGGGMRATTCVEQDSDALAGLGRDAQHLVGGQPEHLLDLLRVAVRLGRGQVDLVQRRDDLEVVLEGEIAVGERLRLDALGGVDEEHDALAGGEAAAHLVAEVDVARRVDQVEDVVAPVDPHVLGLDRDAALALDVHRVEVLLAHVPGVDRVGELEDAVRERRLAVVDVADDGEVADALGVDHNDHGATLPGPARSGHRGAPPGRGR